MRYIVSSFGIECPETGRAANRIDGVDNRRFLHPQYWERDNEYKSPAEAVDAITSEDANPVFVTTRGKIIGRAAAESLMRK